MRFSLKSSLVIADPSGRKAPLRSVQSPSALLQIVVCSCNNGFQSHPFWGSGGSNIYTNTALITWKWNNQEPVVARMTFIFKGNCIMQLHSSQLPDPPEELTRLKN